jgi:death-on-curing protein
VAAGTISKELLGEWMRAILNGQDDDESLKLKIYQAISGDTQQT